MSISGRGWPGRSRGGFLPLALAVFLIETTGCSTSAEFPGTSAVEFHIDFAAGFPVGTYDFHWTNECVMDCPSTTLVSCSGTFHNYELAMNVGQSNQAGHGEVVRLRAFRSDYPDNIVCQPQTDPNQGLWLYHLEVTYVPSGERLVESACNGKIFWGQGIFVNHRTLVPPETSTQCVPEVGGGPPS